MPNCFSPRVPAKSPLPERGEVTPPTSTTAMHHVMPRRRREEETVAAVLFVGRLCFTESPLPPQPTATTIACFAGQERSTSTAATRRNHVAPLHSLTAVEGRKADARKGDEDRRCSAPPVAAEKNREEGGDWTSLLEYAIAAASYYRRRTRKGER